MSEKDRINQVGSGSINIGVGINNGAIGNAVIAGQYNAAPSEKNLTQVSKEINALIEQFSDDYDSTPIGNMQMGAEVINRVDRNPTLKSRVVNAIKEAGIEAFKQAISHPSAAIIAAGAEGFIDAE